MGMINQFLDTLGTGAGTTNANGDYSSTAEEFYIQSQVKTAESYNIHRMIVSIE